MNRPLFSDEQDRRRGCQRCAAIGSTLSSLHANYYRAFAQLAFVSGWDVSFTNEGLSIHLRLQSPAKFVEKLG